ncbi:MAG: hypothetical protein OXI64_06715 [Defluviicoccus sp.]|nr:hypothetical protein [Defluviicoccus sp.]
MKDIGLSEFLSSRGFAGANAGPVLERLCARGLTRPGKTRIATCKTGAVDEALRADFARHCGKSACKPSDRDTREPVVVAPEHCEFCGGSDNRRAVERMLESMRRTGWTKLLVVGGSPGTRRDLDRLCEDRIELRFVTEETPPGKKKIGALLRWSDITVVWTSTEISHKATAVISGEKVLKVSRRGVAALADGVRRRCRDFG